MVDAANRDGEDLIGDIVLQNQGGRCIDYGGSVVCLSGMSGLFLLGTIGRALVENVSASVRRLIFHSCLTKEENIYMRHRWVFGLAN
jgi:hypothetical protein